VLDKGDLIEFKIGGLTKTRRVGQGPLSLQFAVYSTETKLDVVSCIRAYIARTFSLRQTETQLLISYVKPHKKVQPCSVARWLQSMMQEAGIDTSIYKAHSTRGASTSKAKTIGLSAKEIMERANWTRELTFKRYYYRETENSAFQSAVLH
jgi:hypothetical protein